MSYISNMISQFFAGKSATREECDDYATRMFGGPVKVVEPQGRFSYTVTAGNDTLIIQFRERGNPLNTTNLLDLLLRTHGDLVAPYSLLGGMGGMTTNGLDVYKMNKLPGVNCSVLTELLAENPVALGNFVDSLAHFFAQAWTRGRPDGLSSGDRGRLATECKDRLDELSRSLPDRFRPLVALVRENIDDLYDGKYPITITHGDFSDSNMLADETSVVLTGVVDWAEASVLPFGFALYALDNSLGYMGKNGWVSHDNAEVMRERFWSTFCTYAQPSREERERMKVARLAGILFRYGTRVNSGFPGMLGIRGSSDGSLRFLEAFTA